MRVVIQRVSSACVTIDDRVAGQIGRGLLVLVGIETADTVADGEWLAQKICKLRIFDDMDGKMNLSLLDLATNESGMLRPSPGDGTRQAVALAQGDVLLVSQFTLHASTQKGARPSFNKAARPEHARPLYEQFVAQLTAVLGRPVQTGQFGALMQVALVNDGPVTFVIDSKERASPDC
jgi:D-tyrosyl-tRNA(Tyr) deacylase